MSGYYFSPLKKIYGDTEEFYFYSISKTLVIGKKDLSKMLGVTLQSIDKYEKKGLSRSSLAIPRVPIYDLIYAIDWYRDNINQKHREEKNQNIQDNNPIPEDLEDYIKQMQKMELIPEKYLPADEIARRRAYKGLEQDTVKTATIKGELIEADKIDFAKAEVSIMLLSHLRSFKKIFNSLVSHILLPNKDDELAQIVDGELKNMIDGLNEFTHVQIPTEDNVYFWDIIATIIELLKKGVTPKQLIERLNSGKG